MVCLFCVDAYYTIFRGSKKKETVCACMWGINLPTIKLYSQSGIPIVNKYKLCFSTVVTTHDGSVHTIYRSYGSSAH